MLQNQFVHCKISPQILRKLLPKKTAAKPEDNLGAAIYNGKILHEG
jgi:hypothetical protein